jgi:hypothetical protein
MDFEAALGQEALGVFGRTGLTPSQLADGLTEALIIAGEERSLRLGAEKAEKTLFEGLTDCQTTRDSWVSGVADCNPSGPRSTGQLGMTGIYTLSDKLREYAERAVNLDELRPLMVKAANEIDRLNAENEELIRGMTEMAERFTRAMDRAST